MTENVLNSIMKVIDLKKIVIIGHDSLGAVP